MYEWTVRDGIVRMKSKRKKCMDEKLEKKLYVWKVRERNVRVKSKRKNVRIKSKRKICTYEK